MACNDRDYVEGLEDERRRLSASLKTSRAKVKELKAEAARYREALEKVAAMLTEYGYGDGKVMRVIDDALAPTSLR